MTGGELGRCQVVERAVRTHLVVIATPGGDEDTRLRETGEPLVVEAFVAEAAVEAFDEGVLGRLARLDELQADTIVERRSATNQPKIVPARLLGDGCDDLFVGRLVAGHEAGRGDGL